MAQNVISILIKAVDDASGVFKSVGSNATTAGRSLTTGLSLPMAAVAGASLKMAGDFEQSLNILQSVSSATDGQMEQLRATARALGNDVSLPGVGAKDAALAMNELAKAGLDVNAVLTASKGVLSLAKAGQIDTAFAAEVTANALNAFNLEGKEATRVADMLAGGANGSSASIQDLALGMQMASAGANALSVPINDLISGLGLMSNNAIKGSDAGTSLKTFMNNLTPTTDRAKAAFKAMNLQLFDAGGNFVGMREAARQLQAGTANMTDQQKLFNMEAAFGSDAMRAAIVLSKEGASGFDKMSAAVTKQGAATELAAAQNKGFNGALDNLKSTAETAMIDIGSRLLPLVTRSLKSGADMVTRFTDAFNGLTDEQQNAIFKLAAFVAITGPALLVLGRLATATSTAVTSIKAFNTAVTGMQAASAAAAGASGIAGLAGSASRALPVLGALVTMLTGPVGFALLGVGAAVGVATIAMSRQRSQSDQLAQAQRNLRQSTDELRLAQEGLSGAELNVEGAQLAVEAAQRRYNEAVQMFGPGSLEARQALHDLRVQQEFLKDAQDKVRESLELLKRKQEEVARNKEIVKDAQEKSKAIDGIRTAADGAVISINKLAKKVQNTNAAGQKIDLAPLLKPGRNATGTSFAPGGSTWVGENGPELLNVPRGSAIMPSYMARQFRGQGGGEIVINEQGTYNFYTAEAVDAWRDNRVDQVQRLAQVGMA